MADGGAPFSFDVFLNIKLKTTIIHMSTGLTVFQLLVEFRPQFTFYVKGIRMVWKEKNWAQIHWKSKKATEFYYPRDYQILSSVLKTSLITTNRPSDKAKRGCQWRALRSETKRNKTTFNIVLCRLECTATSQAGMCSLDSMYLH